MSTKTSDNDDFVQIQQPAEMSPTELTPAESKAGDTVPPPPPEMPLEPVEDESGESVIQGRVEDGANPPIKLIQLESLLTLLKEIPGFGLQGSVYQFRSPISGTALTDLLKQTDRISHISLSDLDKESLAPSVFVRLALLRNPAGYLFPSLSEIAINKGNTFLEFLSVFSSPALRQLKITGVDEANETPLAAFLGTGSAEAAELKSVLLDDNVLSQKTVEYVAKFSHLKTLHLIDTLPSFDFHLLEMLGRIQTLEDFSFCQSSSSIEYRSQATVHAEAESNRLAEEKEQRRLAEENERKRLEVVREREAVEKRQREQLEKEKEQRKMEEAKSLLQKLGPRGAELATQLDSNGLEIVAALAQPQSPEQIEVPEVPLGQPSGLWALPTNSLGGKKKKKGRNVKGSSTLNEQPAISPTVPMQGNSALKLVATFFVNLKTLSITGPPVLVKDLIDITHSRDLEKLAIIYIEGTAQQADNTNTNTPSPPSDVARIVVSRWSNTLSRATMDIEKLSAVSGATINLPGAILKQLLVGFSLHHLELKGWTIEGLDITLRSFPPPSPFIPSLSKLEYLSLPSHVGASELKITHLEVLAKTFSNLKTLQCRLQHIPVPIPMPIWSFWPSKTVRNRKLQSLTIGDDPDTTHADPLRVISIARYIDHLFPELSVLEGSEQNTEQWEMIGKVVKMLQEVRLDERKDVREDASKNRF